MICVTPLQRSALGASVFVFAAACVEPPEEILSPHGPASAIATACDARPNDTVAKLTECVTLDGVIRHLVAFQLDADANGGHRMSGTLRHEASADYVTDLLGDAGYAVTSQSFQYDAYVQMSPTILEQLAPFVTAFRDGVDHGVMTGSSPGDVTAVVVAVDAAASSGCEPADFAGFPAGSIGLVQRGTCTFQLKAENAASAGAAAAIIINHEFDEGIIAGTLGQDYSGGIPVVSMTWALGQELILTAGVIMRLAVNADWIQLSTRNIIAETSTGDPSNTIVIGAHLGSDDGSPGINNNGSGSAALLETALRMAGVKTRNRVLFASGTEASPLGSATYLSGLDADALANIALYFNVDQIASPNFVPFVVDGDATGDVMPPGSEGIEQFLRDEYARRGAQAREARSAIPSDWLSFVMHGIAAGAITTGGDGLKTEEEASVFGGTAGIAYDPCTNLPCDTRANIHTSVLDLNSDVVAADSP